MNGLGAAAGPTKDEEEASQTFSLPKHILSGFEEVPPEYEEMFEAFIAEIVESYIAKEPKLALEFPITDSMGRSIIHKVANYFDLASHSKGNKTKLKRAVIYPKTMFLEKQASE